VELQGALALRAMNGAPGHLSAKVLCQGDGWTVNDVICTSGPRDRSFEERHARVSIAIVLAGSFQYRSQCGYRATRELMTPGSILLGNLDQCFECGHEHGSGDRCLSFRYTAEYFERVAADAGIRGTKPDFRVLRLPPLRALSPLITCACAVLDPAGPAKTPWEELAIKLAAQAVQLANSISPTRSNPSPSAVARVTRAIRMMEEYRSDDLTLGTLAGEAGLSPYHFLRTFEHVTGVTPHRYILRMRLREAAIRLSTEPARILDIALDCGFGDVSNFNRAFRAEFGYNPRAFRRSQIR
jgi:AraC family transcriptional regulator